MNLDKLGSERSGNTQSGDRTSQQRSTKFPSYRDAFVNSGLRWKNCFQEWGLEDLEMEVDELDASRTGDEDTVDGIPSIKLDIETQKRIIQPWR
ncbi:hypothetical protein MKX03_023618, partial [Papaver bracteatum]